MTTLLFQPQFARLVASGEKTQTVRRVPARMPRVGDRVSLRMWRGKPYRSKQKVLREGTICQVHYLRIEEVGVATGADATRLTRACARQFARSDGFADWPEMRDWFRSAYGLPFEGIVISWRAEP